MLSIDHLSMEFSARPLFTDVSFHVNAKERIALVGKNGAGKSTLLRLIAGEMQPTGGTIARRNGLKIGYLPQVMELSNHRTLIEETLTLPPIAQHQAEHLEDWEREEADRQLRAEAERTLVGLGFQRSDLDRPTGEFSGGWRMRVELAKLLLQQPDLLLLDEPTNHLDIGSITWLEQFLLQRANAVVLVSHDRAFLNRVTNRTIEISCGTIADYKVNYDQFVKLRAERREQQLRAYENQQKEMAEIRQFIEKFRYKPTKSNQVQSRMKALEKMVPIEVDEVDNSRLHLKFPPCQRSGDFPVICEEVGKKYGDHTVFSGVNLSIRRGEKVAFVGNNGEGKTTLVKCIMGQIPFDGKLAIAQNVQIGYFAQNQAQMLDGDITVFDTIDRVARGEMRTKVRDILGAFLFGSEASDKFVKVLSGGERSRLAMIKLLLEPVNLLILDEPTNHLDMASKDVLKQAIKDFDGTVILVSHDRDFLDGLVDQIYEFKNAKIRHFIGGIWDFLGEESGENRETNVTISAAAEEKKAEAKLSYQEQKEKQKALRKAEKDVADAEKRVSELETRLKALEAKLSAGDNSSELLDDYAKTNAALEAAMTDWEAASEALEGLSATE